jgi:transcriptional regulator with XRE-family HTH domain
MNPNIQASLVFVNKYRLFDFTSKSCNTMQMTKLGDRLKIARERKGIKTQAELAKLIGVTQQTIQQIESGETQRTRYLDLIANALDVSRGWLLGDENIDFAPVPLQKIDLPPIVSIPLLEFRQITEWVKDGILPINNRSVNIFMKNQLSDKTYGIDITNDAISFHVFPLQLPGRCVLAVADPLATPEPQDVVLVDMGDGKIKFRQYWKDGEEFFLKSLEPNQPLVIVDEKIKILGVIEDFISTKEKIIG